MFELDFLTMHWFSSFLPEKESIHKEKDSTRWTGLEYWCIVCLPTKIYGVFTEIENSLGLPLGAFSDYQRENKTGKKGVRL